MKKHVALLMTLVGAGLMSSLALGQVAAEQRTQSAPRQTAIRITETQLSREQMSALAALSGQDLRVRVINKPGVQAIIVIYGSDGGCRVCLGKGSECALACKRPGAAVQ